MNGPTPLVPKRTIKKKKRIWPTTWLLTHKFTTSQPGISFFFSKFSKWTILFPNQFIFIIANKQANSVGPEILPYLSAVGAPDDILDWKQQIRALHGSTKRCRYDFMEQFPKRVGWARNSWNHTAYPRITNPDKPLMQQSEVWCYTILHTGVTIHVYHRRSPPIFCCNLRRLLGSQFFFACRFHQQCVANVSDPVLMFVEYRFLESRAGMVFIIHCDWMLGLVLWNGEIWSVTLQQMLDLHCTLLVGIQAFCTYLRHCRLHQLAGLLVISWYSRCCTGKKLLR